jgi:DNA-binding NtrC family response regulator
MRGGAGELEQQYDLRGMVWRDAATERVLELACQVARADVPVLITGPNGSGKERIAEIIQANSGVKDGPFVTLNCGALPSELIEAELFGAEAGAYTGAGKARAGKFEAADRGTLFLDEIGNLPPAGQVKLLRVLETGRFQRLGSNEEKKVQGARHQRHQRRPAGDDPRRHFPRRPVLPPERDRAGAAAAGEAARRHPAAGAALPRRRPHAAAGGAAGLAAARLARQRARTEERHAARRPAGARRTITAADLGLPAAPAPEAESVLTREAIEQALARHGGVVAQAAAELGLSRQALYRRMERLGIARGAG